MNGELAQMISLICYGNDFIKNGTSRNYSKSNVLLSYCDQVHFIAPSTNLIGKISAQVVAKSPEAWFAYLKKRAVRSLRLSHTPKNQNNIADHLTAGFSGGGGNRAIEVILPNLVSEFWEAHWEVWNPDAPDHKIWRVNYGMVTIADTITLEKVSLKDVLNKLETSLDEIHSFSKQNDCGGFTDCFASALETMRTGSLSRHAVELAPEGILSKDAELILEACDKASVFGGMGSWNDMGFEGETQTEYDRVSEQLYGCIHESIMAAIRFGINI